MAREPGRGDRSNHKRPSSGAAGVLAVDQGERLCIQSRGGRWSVSADAALMFQCVHDVFCNRKRAGRGGRRRVADIDEAGALLDGEVVQKDAVAKRWQLLRPGLVAEARATSGMSRCKAETNARFENER